MKIILSPSKTQDFSIDTYGPMTEPIYDASATKLNNILKRTSKKALGELMNIHGDLLNETFANIRTFSEASPKPAVAVYTGLVYKYFDLASYGDKEVNYLNTHLCILSAKYGILRPYDGIRPYRLDMKMKPGGKDLYTYWKKAMDESFQYEDVIIDLASGEFSKMVTGNKITVGFRDYNEGNYKNLATYAKMARGMLLHQMVINKTQTIEALKSLTFGDYTFNEEISRDKLILFSRTI